MLILGKGTFSGNTIRHITGNGLICASTIYNKHHFDNRLHCHENAHLSFMIDGICGEKKKTYYDRKPGHITFYHAGEPHQVIGMSQGSHQINIEIEPGFMKRYQLDEQLFGKYAQELPELKFMMVKIAREMACNDETTNIGIEALLLSVLSVEQPPVIHGTGLPQWVTHLKSYLQDCWNTNPSLTELASIAGVHPVTISKYFSRYFGCTLSEYLRKIKTDRAIALIKSVDSSLSDIAYTCGFADQSHFIRTFKIYTGMLPSAYQTL